VQTHIFRGQIKTGLLSVTRLPFMIPLARALNRKDSPDNKSLYEPVTVEVLSRLESRDTGRCVFAPSLSSTMTHPQPFIPMRDIIILCNEERLRTQWESKGSWHADRVRKQKYVCGKTFSLELEGGCTRDIAGNSG